MNIEAIAVVVLALIALFGSYKLGAFVGRIDTLIELSDKGEDNL
jgi:hypothetical protein